MIGMRIYTPEECLNALRNVAGRSGRRVAGLFREAIRRVWPSPLSDGPAALWDGVPTRTSVEHDEICDNRP